VLKLACFDDASVRSMQVFADFISKRHECRKRTIGFAFSIYHRHSQSNDASESKVENFDIGNRKGEMNIICIQRKQDSIDKYQLKLI
jgi:hypothetical protein